MDIRSFDVLNLGAGWQSSRVLLGACRGELPRFDVAVFADTQWEPRAVYGNLEFLRVEAGAAGIPLVTRTAGDLRADAIEFRRNRQSSDGKRFASIPLFIRNPDGSQGRIRRQCTRDYKIDVVDRFIRRELLGISPGARVPRGVLVRQWFGISADEPSRCVFPGRSDSREIPAGVDLLGRLISIRRRKWHPCPWKAHVYPLLNEIWRPDRSIETAAFLPARETRSDCGDWLARHYPGRTFPRSACVGCPFRSNAEWRDMRDNRPEEWADACDFDEAMRAVDATGQSLRRKTLVGLPYLHRQLVPLRDADLGGSGESGGGCGTLFDGDDGMCDV